MFEKVNTNMKNRSLLRKVDSFEQIAKSSASKSRVFTKLAQEVSSAAPQTTALKSAITSLTNSFNAFAEKYRSSLPTAVLSAVSTMSDLSSSSNLTSYESLNKLINLARSVYYMPDFNGVQDQESVKNHYQRMVLSNVRLVLTEAGKLAGSTQDTTLGKTPRALPTQQPFPRSLQRKLNEFVFDRQLGPKVSEDGRWSPATKVALEAFRKTYTPGNLNFKETISVLQDYIASAKSPTAVDVEHLNQSNPKSVQDQARKQRDFETTEDIFKAK